MFKIKYLNFLTPQFKRYYSSEPLKKKLGIIGVPFDKGQTKLGVNEAPELLRQAGLIKDLNSLSKFSEINDYGDIQFNAEKCNEMNNMLNYSDFIGVSKTLAGSVKKLLKQNDQLLVLGGDHAIGFGSVAGHLAYNPNLTVIWIDAHADLNLNTSSGTGNIHGMPVAMLLDELKSHWLEISLRNVMKNYLPARNLIYIGLRDIDPYESWLINDLRIKAYGMNDIDKYGVPKILEMVLDSIEPNNSLHVSFDIDSLDVPFCPSTGTPVTAGLTLREGIYIVETLCKTNKLQCLDLVEINPKLGNEVDVETTLKSGMEIIKAAFGNQRKGNPKNELKRN